MSEKRERHIDFYFCFYFDFDFGFGLPSWLAVFA